MGEDGNGAPPQNIADLLKADADMKAELATIKNELKWLKRIIPGAAGLVALLILVFWNIERGKIGDRVRAALDEEGVKTALSDTRAARDAALLAQEAAQGHQSGAQEAFDTIQAQLETMDNTVVFYSVETLSVDHSSGRVGRYFNFNMEQVDELLGRNDWSEQTFSVMNSRTGKVGLVQLWRHANGGSIGTAHGRFDPWDASANGQWRVGDRALFLSSAE
ncbi:MAG: hypothetical protein AAGK23_10295 [Pseudomonadota bacterium]